MAEARNAYARGKQNFERADVGARNRYEAWKSFREAWLLLEAHPEPKPELYFEARDRMKEAQQELDKTCAKLLLETEGYYNQRNYAAAKHTLDTSASTSRSSISPAPRTRRTSAPSTGCSSPSSSRRCTAPG